MTDTTSPKPQDVRNRRSCTPQERGPPFPHCPPWAGLEYREGSSLADKILTRGLLFVRVRVYGVQSIRPRAKTRKWLIRDSALCLDYLIMPFPWERVLLEAPVTLGIRVQVIDEVLWRKVQGLGRWWFPSTSNCLPLRCEEVNCVLAWGLLFGGRYHSERSQGWW